MITKQQFRSAQRAYDNQTPPEDTEVPCRWCREWTCADVDRWEREGAACVDNCKFLREWLEAGKGQG